MPARPPSILLDSHQKRLCFFQNLLLIATADGEFDAQEGRFLVAVGDQLGLAPADVAPLIEQLPSLTFIIPETGIERTFELQTLVLLMMEDGHIDKREYALCLEYATRIGYGRGLLDDLVQTFSRDSRPPTSAADE